MLHDCTIIPIGLLEQAAGITDSGLIRSRTDDACELMITASTGCLSHSRFSPLQVGILFLQIYSIRRNVDHIYLFTFWTLRTLALSMDVAFDRTEWYDFMHLMLAFAWLCACGIRSYSGGGHDSSAGSNTPRKPNFIRGLFFSWMDSTYREAHRGSVSFYQGTLFQGTLPEDRRCEQLLELYEKANARRGYTAVDDGSGRMESERCRFTIGKLLSPFRGEIILAGLNRFVLISLFFLCPYLLR